MQLSITIDLGNDAMRTASEVSAAIQKSLARGGGSRLFEPLVLGESNSVLDGNGNTVGTWKVVADESYYDGDGPMPSTEALAVDGLTRGEVDELRGEA